MKLLYIHGPPASGKRTIAEAVHTFIGGRLFPNHVAIDYAKTVLDFDGSGFWDLVHAVRVAALEAAARQGEPLVMYTCCYSHPHDLPLVEGFEKVIARHGGELLPVHVTCSRETLEERVMMPDRAELRKLTTREGLARFLDRWNLVALARQNCLTVDTDYLSPSEAANEIIRHFGLAAEGERASGDAKQAIGTDAEHCAGRRCLTSNPL